MSDLDRLKQMDPEEIYKKTFVLPKVIKALIQDEFDKLGNKAKALGFVAILERELKLDLSELRQKIEDHFGQNSVEYDKVFEVREKEHKRSLMPFLALLIVVLFAAGGYYYYTNEPKKQIEASNDFFVSSSSSSVSIQISSSSEAPSSKEPSSISSSTSSYSSQALVADTNTSEETPEPEAVAEANATEINATQELAVLPSVTLIPKRKLWVGIIYLDDYSKKNYITKKPIELNTSRDQLIVTGHGLLTFDIDGQMKEYNSQNKLRFIYRAGELEEIDRKSFRLYNRGKSW